MNRTATLLGQGLSSASNLVFQLALVHVLPARSFGVVVAMLSVYYLGLAVTRAAVGDVLVGLLGESWTTARRLAAQIGLICCGIAILGAVVVPVESSSTLILAMAMPVLMVNDAMRYRAWAASRPALVIVMDGAWLALVVGIGIGTVVFISHDVGGLPFVAAWVAGAAVSTFIASRSLGPDAGQPVIEASANRAIRTARRGFLGDQLPQAIASNLLPIAVAVVLGPDLAAGQRAALLPFMIAETVVLAVRVSSMASVRDVAVEVGARGRRGLWRQSRVLLAAALLGSLPAVALVLDPGRRFLGESGAQVGIGFLLAGAIVVTRAGGRSSADVVAMRSGLRGTGALRVASSVLDLVGSLVGGLIWGLTGLLAARAVVAMSTSIAWVVRAAMGTEPARTSPSSERSR